jgi:hypothetical protein
LTDQSLFEKNIMPKLIKEYKEANNTKIPFDLEKIKRLGMEGFATRAWDEGDLQTAVNDLVKKGLIDAIGDGKYQISDLGIGWKEEPS